MKHKETTPQDFAVEKMTRLISKGLEFSRAQKVSIMSCCAELARLDDKAVLEKLSVDEEREMQFYHTAITEIERM